MKWPSMYEMLDAMIWFDQMIAEINRESRAICGSMLLARHRQRRHR